LAIARTLWLTPPAVQVAMLLPGLRRATGGQGHPVRLLLSTAKTSVPTAGHVAAHVAGHVAGCVAGHTRLRSAAMRRLCSLEPVR